MRCSGDDGTRWTSECPLGSLSRSMNESYLTPRYCRENDDGDDVNAANFTSKSRLPDSVTIGTIASSRPYQQFTLFPRLPPCFDGMMSYCRTAPMYGTPSSSASLCITTAGIGSKVIGYQRVVHKKSDFHLVFAVADCTHTRAPRNWAVEFPSHQILEPTSPASPSWVLHQRRIIASRLARVSLPRLRLHFTIFTVQRPIRPSTLRATFSRPDGPWQTFDQKPRQNLRTLVETYPKACMRARSKCSCES
jgi:hypothetical protein